MSSSPQVTVVIPTRDRWPLLSAGGLRAALLQEDVDVEVVVVDDGSRDGTAERLSSIGEARLSVIRHNRPLGVARARNAGIEKAAGQWVAFLDDDDVWSPWKLKAQVEAAEAAGAGFAYSGAIWIDEEGEIVNRRLAPEPAHLKSSLLRWNVLWGGASNVIARGDLLRRLGGFDEALFQLADWDLWIRLAREAEAAVIREWHVGLRMHSGSMLVADRRDVFRELERLTAKHGGLADRVRFARWAGAGAVRSGRRLAAARTYVRGTRHPGNLLRAGVALAGPNAMTAAGRVRARVAAFLSPGDNDAARPEWLDLYR